MTRRVVSLGVAIVFGAVLLSFLLYTRQMGEALRRDSEVFGRIYANAFRGTITDDPRQVDRALFEILRESLNLRIPIVLTDLRGNPTSAANTPFRFDPGDSASVRRMRAYVRQLDAKMEPFEAPEFNLTIHFGEPRFLGWLRWIPWLQAAVLLVSVGGGGWLIHTSFRAERERVWSAMARESAHQMGTPLSSLTGWLEQLQEARSDGRPAGTTVAAPPGEEGERGGDPGSPDVLREMEADVERLLKVSHRFELIGRSPSLRPVSLPEVVERLESYFSARLPTLGGTVRFDLRLPGDMPDVRGNATLLEWAFENLIKNSLDALAGREGVIRIVYLGCSDGRVELRVEDTGPGVPPRLRKRLFEIGVSSKERGWGVGLSLTRRIVVEMHDGEIALEPDRPGASFRLALPEARGPNGGGGTARA